MEDRHNNSRSKLTWLEHLSIVREPRSVRSGIKFLVTHARHRHAIDYKAQHSIDMNLQNADVAAHAVHNLLVEQNAKHDNTNATARQRRVPPYPQARRRIPSSDNCYTAQDVVGWSF